MIPEKKKKVDKTGVITFKEFRIFLVKLLRNFELFLMFYAMDKNQDDRVDVYEFEQAVSDIAN